MKLLAIFMLFMVGCGMNPVKVSPLPQYNKHIHIGRKF